ncbi:uncharacterized protein LOC111085146 [Limulus polyphemus]|uniref:Uncharacterized protein LOC111085146 n=1 Tax=Limulus polyphemus TaxID=6850 RepID=A0ABM1S3I7_LIMPO|nr:uncharacterized protein LOC111085146 [Limulus polyphemus]
MNSCLGRIVFLILLFVLEHLNTSLAIQCYLCNSKYQEGCDEVADDTYLKNCSELKEGPKYVGCRKIDQWIDFEMLGESKNKRIIRQCALDTEEKDCYYRAGYGSRTNICHCFEDKCNAAAELSVTAGIIMLGVFSLIRLFV